MEGQSCSWDLVQSFLYMPPLLASPVGLYQNCQQWPGLDQGPDLRARHVYTAVSRWSRRSATSVPWYCLVPVSPRCEAELYILPATQLREARQTLLWGLVSLEVQ